MNTLSFTRVGDYLLPNLILSESPDDVKPLGRYGTMHKESLREHRSILYSQLLLTGRLYPLCREIDEAAKHRLATIPNRDAAHEIILAELVYA